MAVISKKITNILADANIIKKEEIQQCQYGLDVFISSMLVVTSIVLLSALVGNVAHSVIFFLMFIPLRIFAGGYHASTKIRCYFVSLAVYILYTLATFYAPKGVYIPCGIVCTLISVVVVFEYAPIIHENKSVNYIEIKTFKKISRTICCVETGLILVLACLLKNEHKVYVLILALGQMAEVISIIVAVLQNKLMKKGGCINEKV